MRSALWYLLFVGLPVVALIGVLRLGEGLTAPRAVHGLYSVTFDSSANRPCLADLTTGRPSEISVAQSGRRLDLKLGDVVLTGSIADDSISARSTLDSFRTPGCLTVDTIAMSAAALRKGSARTLVGQLLFRGCAQCPPAPFRAVRIPARSSNRGLDA